MNSVAFGYSLQEVSGELDAAALPGRSLQHAAHGFGQPHLVVRYDSAHSSETALFEGGLELPPEPFALAGAHLDAQQLAAVGIEAHGDDDGVGAELQRLAQPAVEIGDIEEELRSAASIEGPLQEGLDMGIEPLADVVYL